MRKIEKRAGVCLLLVLALLLGIGVFSFRYVTRGGDWAAWFPVFSGRAASGRVLDRDGDILSCIDDSGRRVYYANPVVRQATVHAVGDLQGRIGSGALTAFSDKLSGYNLLTGLYTLTGTGKDLYLTMDAHLNYVAHQAMWGRSGTVAVYNYKTGEILCMYSAPNFDPENPPSEADAPEGAYVNRFLSALYPPGSVFKIVTLVAALEYLPGVEDRLFSCTGVTDVGGEAITCIHAHGDQTLTDALANSCNGVFAALAAELGAERLTAAAEQLGLTSVYEINGQPIAQGVVDLTGAAAGELGWAGVGQHTDLVNPCAVMVAMGAIGNGGQAAIPQLLLKTGRFGLYGKKMTEQLIDPAAARTVADMMANNVHVTYGDWRFPNMDICAKSGTAEVGDGKQPHAWFAGFLRGSDTPYAFVALVENGGSGAQAAGDVAAAVLNTLVNG